MLSENKNIYIYIFFFLKKTEGKICKFSTYVYSFRTKWHLWCSAQKKETKMRFENTILRTLILFFSCRAPKCYFVPKLYTYVENLYSLHFILDEESQMNVSRREIRLDTSIWESSKMERREYIFVFNFLKCFIIFILF